MRVDHPAHLDDSMITKDTHEFNEAPLSVPKSISFFNCRIKLAELCRETVDLVPSIVLKPNDLPDFELVLMLGAKFHDFIRILPPFFQLGPTRDSHVQQLYQDQPHIALQRVLLDFSANTRLCRLHRPFIVEGANNSHYSFSRITSARAAQEVLALRHSRQSLSHCLSFPGLQLRRPKS